MQLTVFIQEKADGGFYDNRVIGIRFENSFTLLSITPLPKSTSICGIKGSEGQPGVVLKHSKYLYFLLRSADT